MSSYKQNNYDLVFESLVCTIRPKKIVEIGILDGFSLEAMARAATRDCFLYGYDLFDDYKYKHARLNNIKNKFSKYKNVIIKKADYGNIYKLHTDDSIDILHIDISNTGDTYQFFLDKYISKISQGGIAILEGGSKERDEYEWMKKFNFNKIRPIINKISTKYATHVLEPFPSLTIIKK